MPKIAIIGCGLIGETHARCLASLGVSDLLFIDSDPERAKNLAEEFSGTFSSNVSEAFERPEIDAVYICTYHDTHAPLAVRAARAGKHVFLEKPMAVTGRDCDEIVVAVQKNNVRCMSGFKLHYYSLVKRAKRMVDRPITLTGRIADQRWPDDSWANDPVRGGGNVLSQGCHAVELLTCLANARPIRIYAEGGNLHHSGLDIIDSMAATIAFDNGAVATLLVGDTGESRPNGKFSFEAMDGSHAIYLDQRLTRLTYFDGKNAKQITADEDGFLHENIEFLAMLKEGRAPETNEVDGARATKILLAGIESIRTHQPQSLENIP